MKWDSSPPDFKKPGGEKKTVLEGADCESHQRDNGIY